MTDIIAKIKELDQILEKEVYSIKKHIRQLQFDTENAIEYCLTENTDWSAFENKKKIKGLYLFEVKLDDTIKGVKIASKINDFVTKYQRFSNRHTYSAKIINKRVMEAQRKHTKEWLPIYIGKCKDVYKRILEHISMPTNKRTYAMKLLSRENLYGLHFRVSVIEMDIENYDLVMGFLEKELREIYNPIIGRQ